MGDLFDALDRIRRWQEPAWASAAASGHATPDTDGQLRAIWEARELLDAAASSLAVLRVGRPYDSDLSGAERLLATVHDRVYRIECARHRELGSVAPGERGARVRRSARTADYGPAPGVAMAPATPACGPTGRR